MNKLKHITFTGVDEKTVAGDIKILQEIQKEYPYVEFGVLTSYHWFENGNRYLDPRLFRYLTQAHLNLALHICGEAAHDAACGKDDEIHYLSWGKHQFFRRIQLNISNRQDNPPIVEPTPWGHEIIIQQKDVDHLDLYNATRKDWKDYIGRLSVLLDASGGQGIDTDIKILQTDKKVGYAGGFNPDNVEKKLSYLMENVNGPFWIDMETGVRTDDWFDINKVKKVLEICDPIVKEWEDK